MHPTNAAGRLSPANVRTITPRSRGPRLSSSTAAVRQAKVTLSSLTQATCGVARRSDVPGHDCGRYERSGHRTL
jgi:hypothetical protein